MGIFSSICCCSKKDDQWTQDPLFHLKKIDKITSPFSKPLADFPIDVKTNSDDDADSDRNVIEIPEEDPKLL
ncbi:hypothetical protein M9Y10_033717 [Tritrichomonas musculus]|uniref:Uncharacterized protein n=1 Tax=Tritrichomonas musculus TaxID=1915356 RepID=A0ABR2KDN5_9EUKA